MQKLDTLPDDALIVERVSKTYRGNKQLSSHKALDSVTLRVPRGSIFGLLGPNGAGKSTLINILAGLVIKSEGQVKIWGMDIDQHPRNVKAAIGIVPQELNIDPFFTPAALMNIHAGMYGVPKSERKTDEILQMIGLADKKNAYARTLSGGMRRRLLIGKAMVHAPPILVLDEPTAGVDIELRQKLWENVVTLNKRGTTILLTTHYLEEAEQLCDEIAIINHGRVVAHDKKNALLARLDSKTVRITIDQTLEILPPQLQAMGADLRQDQEGRSQIQLSYSPSQTNTAEIIARINSTGLKICDISTKEGKLEDLFLQITRV